jgi:hypothetical protein
MSTLQQVAYSASIADLSVKAELTSQLLDIFTNLCTDLKSCKVPLTSDSFDVLDQMADKLITALYELEEQALHHKYSLLSLLIMGSSIALEQPFMKFRDTVAEMSTRFNVEYLAFDKHLGIDIEMDS